MILILDFGSQYTQLIARRVREMKVYCEIHPCTLSGEQIKALAPQAIILSGGPSSVLGEASPTVDKQIFDWGLPILGVCYGQQLMVALLGGKVENAGHSEYGRTELKICGGQQDFFFSVEQTSVVWMSHGDRVINLPEGFEVWATSANAPYAAIANPARQLYGIQFHPEVTHSVFGKEMIHNFLFEIAKAKPDWSMANFLSSKSAEIKAQVGEAKVICGLSGGVDSSVTAILLHEALGGQLICVFVDNGLLRKDEAKQVVSMFREHYKINLVHVDAADHFLSKLDGVSDPEKKRKIIGHEFIEIFDQEAHKLQGVKFLAQGTLYPDVIESVSFKGPSAVIKSHHNVGGLPEKMNLALIEPMRELFKDEVRTLGRELGLPESFINRHPFPGPGLAVRIPGAVTKEKVATLQEADAIILEEIRAAGWYDKIWQCFGVLLPVKSVGVMGDARTYEWTLALRSVGSVDAMTADWTHLPYELLGRISNRVINEVPRINRVVYDITSKPPGTIEWE